MSEWDGTAWAGTPVEPRTGPPALKAVYGGAVLNTYMNDRPLSSWMGGSVQQRMATYLRAYRSDWFYKAGRKLSSSFKNLPIELRDGSVDDSAGVQNAIEPADLAVPFDALNPEEQFLRLMEKPNPNQTGAQLRQKLWIRWKFAAAAPVYLENGGGGGLPTALYGISPARLWPSYNTQGIQIGWVMDNDSPNPVPFDLDEIVLWEQNSGDDGVFTGVGVVEAVLSNVGLASAVSRHAVDLLSTGGRIAGMMWPKDHILDEPQFQEAVRNWRSLVSDTNAARRLLLFPEPMEWTPGAATPKQIGIPELAQLNRDDILSAFPIAPEALRVPMPAGLNASGDSRRELETAYWEDLHLDVEDFEEFIQVNLVTRYEAATGSTYDFEMVEPDLDDAPALIEKVGAFKGLVSIGLDPQESLEAVGLEHIKFLGLPALLDPAQQLQMQQAAAEANAQAKQDGGVTAQAGDTNRRDASTSQVQVAKSVKATLQEDREKVEAAVIPDARATLAEFFAAQRQRVAEKIRATMPKAKSARKADDDAWWDADYEDEALAGALNGLYVRVGTGGLQTVADRMERVVVRGTTQRVIDDIIGYGGSRIVGINEATRQAINETLAEGIRRGYSITQLVEGYPSEGYGGVFGAVLENGNPVFGDLRAETIARTETMLSYNRATLNGYDEFGVRFAVAHDGDHDAQCLDRDGRTFPIEDARTIEDHPNGTLDWAPVVDR